MNVSSPILLGVNIDHIATVRQARGTLFPEVIHAALLAEQAGADGITAHLREDRRHIQDRDIELLSRLLQTRLNLEMAVTDEMVGIALNVRPGACCLVPEKREELTTEGGLDIISNFSRIQAACTALGEAGIEPWCCLYHWDLPERRSLNFIQVTTRTPPPRPSERGN